MAKVMPGILHFASGILLQARKKINTEKRKREKKGHIKGHIAFIVCLLQCCPGC